MHPVKGEGRLIKTTRTVPLQTSKGKAARDLKGRQRGSRRSPPNFMLLPLDGCKSVFRIVFFFFFFYFSTF
jgi:hypothetical protein